MVDKKRKLRSGWCMSGFCEGTKPVSKDGRGIRTCAEIEKCACQCHRQIDEMFEAAGMERVLVENPKYFTKPRTYWMPGDPDPNADSMDSPPLPVGLTESDAGPSLVARDRPSVTRTATGRKQKGTLENEVRYVCEQYIQDVFEWDICTPKLVSEEIGRMNAAEPPSTGAVQAVWDRWEKLGFAKQARKPVRFEGFAGESSQDALDIMKRTTRKEQKLHKASIKRGSVR